MKTEFYLDKLTEDNMRWAPVQSRRYNKDKGRFEHSYLSFETMDAALEYAKDLDTVFRVKEVTYYYELGDYNMAKQVLKLLDGKGYQVKGIKGIPPKNIYKNAEDFNKIHTKIEELNAIGVAISSKDYQAQQDVKVSQKMIWKLIEGLPVVEQTPKAPIQPKTYELNLKDPTAWAKAPTQVRVMADAFKAAGFSGKRISSTDIKAKLEELVKSGDLVTRQDPMKVYAYYITDKKRGFQAFGIIPPAPEKKPSVDKAKSADKKPTDTAKAS